MKIVAIMPVRNEGWVLGLSARALLRWVDELVILDHCSNDKTDDIVRDIGKESDKFVVRVFEHNPKWEEMRHRQRLLDTARRCGATHIVTIDADEVVSANLVPHMRDIVGEIPPGHVLQLPWITCRDSIFQQHRSGIWAEQHASAAFVDEPKWYWKSNDGYDFHQRAPLPRPERPFQPITHRGGGILHLQYSSRRRLLAKQALYKMTEVIRWPGRDSLAVINERYNWSVYGAAYPLQANHQTVFDLAPVPSDWWHGYEDLLQYLHIDAEPWQEAEVQRLIGEYGHAKFTGLDLFGVA